MGVRGGLRALSFHVTPPPGLSVGSLLTNCQPALLGNSVLLPTLFLLQRSSHLSWSTRRRSRASSPDTPISPFRCLVLMAATTNCSADAKLAEGIDPRGGAGPTRLCILCPADYIQGLCASPTLPPSPDSSPFGLGWSQVTTWQAPGVLHFVQAPQALQINILQLPVLPACVGTMLCGGARRPSRYQHPNVAVALTAASALSSLGQLCWNPPA